MSSSPRHTPTLQILPIEKGAQQVGKNIKSSKIRYFWKFSVNDMVSTVAVTFSKYSGKMRITNNDEEIFQQKKFVTGALDKTFKDSRSGVKCRIKQNNPREIILFVNDIPLSNYEISYPESTIDTNLASQNDILKTPYER